MGRKKEKSIKSQFYTKPMRQVHHFPISFYFFEGSEGFIWSYNTSAVGWHWSSLDVFRCSAVFYSFVFPGRCVWLHSVLSSWKSSLYKSRLFSFKTNKHRSTAAHVRECFERSVNVQHALWSVKTILHQETFTGSHTYPQQMMSLRRIWLDCLPLRMSPWPPVERIDM